MKDMNTWFVICAIVGTCAIGWTVSPSESTNHPTVFPGTNQPIPLGDTNQPNPSQEMPHVPPR